MIFNAHSYLDQSVEPGCIEIADQAGIVVTLEVPSPSWNGHIYYSLDNETWTEWDGTRITGRPSIYLRGLGNTVITGQNGGSWDLISTVSSYKMAGNIETLLDWRAVKVGMHPAMGAYCFFKWFYHNNYDNYFVNLGNLELPTLTLTPYCYAYMFSRNEVAIPPASLPATNLAIGCYESMFADTNLRSVPALPATILADNCYKSMFSECRSLTAGPLTLPATTLADSCYKSMFANCTSLQSAPFLPAVNLTSHCYENMFLGCQSLIIAPSLPATTLAEYCYSGMFMNCSNLVVIPTIPLSAGNVYRAYYTMFYHCSKVEISEGSGTTLYYTGGPSSAQNNNLFRDTGGSFTGDCTEGVNYYTSNQVI